MSSNTIHVFMPEVYPRRLYVVRGKDKAKLIKQAFCTYDKEDLAGIDESKEWAGACTWSRIMFRDTGKLGVLVWIINNATPPSLAHEAVHVANIMFKELGIDTGYDHDEHYAYMVQWVTDCLWQVVTNKFKEVKV